MKRDTAGAGTRSLPRPSLFLMRLLHAVLLLLTPDVIVVVCGVVRAVLGAGTLQSALKQ